MIVLRVLFNLISTSAAALLGNILGGEFRAALTGEKVQSLHFQYESETGMQLDNYPVITKFYPALLFAMLGKPRWFYALVGGIWMGFLMPDRYEAELLEKVFVPLIARATEAKDMDGDQDDMN